MDWNKGREITDNVIHIKFGYDLGSDLLNRLRYRMELCAWKKKWRRAKREKDWDRLDSLDREYEMLGLP